MPLSLSDLELALDFVSSTAEGGDHRAFVGRQTGKTYWQFDPLVVGELEEELPDDIEDEEKYAPVPDKRELGLGKPLVLDFAREWLPNDFDEVRHMFSKRHAYRNFRKLLLKKRSRSLVQIRIRGDEKGAASLVRAEFDRGRRLMRRPAQRPGTWSPVIRTQHGHRCFGGHRSPRAPFTSPLGEVKPAMPRRET